MLYVMTILAIILLLALAFLWITATYALKLLKIEVDEVARRLRAIEPVWRSKPSGDMHWDWQAVTLLRAPGGSYWARSADACGRHGQRLFDVLWRLVADGKIGALRYRVGGPPAACFICHRPEWTDQEIYASLGGDTPVSHKSLSTERI